MKAVAYHRIVVTLAVLGAVAVCISFRRAQTSSKRAAETRLPTESDGKLDARIQQVRLAGRFEDTVNSLAAAAGMSIVVRWDGMQPDLRNRNVRVERGDVIVGEVLRELLDQATKEGEDRLGFGLEDGVVVIGKTSWVGGVTRFYNVRDFVDEGWVPQGAREISTGLGGGGSASGGSGGLFAGGSYSEQLSELSALVMETVDPESWRDNGGSQGALREVNGVFVVSTTWENHRTIERLLASIRHEAGATPTFTPVPLQRVMVELSQIDSDLPQIFLDPEVDGQPISLRVYDVRNLLRDIWNAERDLRQQFFPGLAPEREDDGGVWTATQLEEAVGTFLRENVMISSWRERGGGTGAMWLWSGRILVRHAADAHSEIEAILNMLQGEFAKDRPRGNGGAATSRPAPWPPQPVAAPAPSAHD